MTNEVAEVPEPRMGEIRDSDMQDFLQVVVRGRPYPRITQRNCHTCTHPLRYWIEAQFIGHTPVPTIVAHIPENEDGVPAPSEASIRNHFKSHHVDRAQEALVERYVTAAEEMGLSLDEYFSTISTEVSTAQMVVDKFNQRMVNDPSFVPNFQEGMAAVKLLKEVQKEVNDQDAGAFDRRDMLVALSMFMAHTRTIFAHYLPREMESAMAELGKLLQNDPILADLIEKTKEPEPQPTLLDQPDDETIEDAEVVEDTFSEPDEPIAEVVAAFDAGPHGVTAPGPFTAEDLDADDDED